MDIINKVKQYPTQQYVNAPIHINNITIHISKDNTYIDFTINNISKTVLKSVYFKIECFDDANDPVSENNTIIYNSLDININPNKSINTPEPIKLIDNTVRKINLIIDKAVFENGDVFRYTPELMVDIKPFEALASNYNIDELDFAKNFLKLKNTEKIKFIPYLLSNEYWACGCGYLNGSQNECNYCNNQKDNILRLYNITDIKTEYKAEVDRQNTLVLRQKEEAKRVQLEKDNFKKEKKRKNKIIILTVTALVIIGFGSYSFMQYDNYNKALYDIETSNYLEARTKLEKFPDYKDSLGLITEVEYQLGLQYLNNKQFDLAIIQFEKIPNFKDTTKQLLLSKRGKAKELYNNKQFKEAFDLYNTIQMDDQDKLIFANTKIELAKVAITNADYPTALQYLLNLSSHTEYTSLFNQANYEFAKQMIATTPEPIGLDSLRQIYETILEVDDSYLDSKDMKNQYAEIYKEANYYEAVNQFNIKNMYEAREMFIKFPDYADTQEYLNSLYFKLEGSYGNKGNNKVYESFKLLPNSRIEMRIFQDVYTFEWLKAEDYKFVMNFGLVNSDSYREILSYENNVIKILNSYDGQVDAYYKISEVPSSPVNLNIPQKSAPAIGMTPDEVRNSYWGNPKEINKTTTAYGTSEQWVYSGYRYIYFDDGVVTAIQE